MKPSLLSALTATLAVAGLVSAQLNGTIVKHGISSDELNGSNFTYPYPVQLFRFTSQLQQLEMAFMDVHPARHRSNGRSIVLLHGKNFCGPTWEASIRKLTAEGYRVVAPDQVGFCKSSKPAAYQFSLHQLALNTKALLDALGVDRPSVMGHSLGGMLATRFGLMYPGAVDDLVLVNPIGLEDYVQKGVPYISIDTSRETEAQSTAASIRAYEQATYYVGEWRPAFDTWVTMLVNIYYGPERDEYVKNQAQIVDLVLTQPVAHDFYRLLPRTLLAIGEKDKTAIGAQWAPSDVKAELGHFDKLGPLVAGQIPNGTLLRFPDLGHAPQISRPEEFHRRVLHWLGSHHG